MTKNLIATMTLFAAAACSAPEKTQPEDLSELAGLDEKSDAFSKHLVLVGSLDYGQTSAPVKYKHPPTYRAFKFGGQKGDKVDIRVHATGSGDAVAWLTDNAFNVIAKNDDADGSLDSHIQATLPGNTNPDIITYYIIFRDYWYATRTFTVSLAKVAPDFYACQVDADCVKTYDGCCPISTWVAVRSGTEDAYHAALGCDANPICPKIATRDDGRFPYCNNTSHKCELLLPSEVLCGAHSLNSHACPDRYACVGPGVAVDAGGSCVQRCGGFAGFPCDDPTLSCADDPNDSCDPANGGADCGGLCLP
jgi:hypothetical protein